jgi:DNA-binding MarR family transcriptional regulator
MSTSPDRKSRQNSTAGTRPPPVKRVPGAEQNAPAPVTPLGAMLRVTHEALTREILTFLREQGIEMTATEFSVMRYPGPDGVRPIDLARRCNMTKQAMNYVLAAFEAKGYIERRSPVGQRSTTIYLTAKGWKLLSAIRQCASEIEARWAAHIGIRRFDALRASLHEIAVWLGKLPARATNTDLNGGSPDPAFRSQTSGRGMPANFARGRALNSDRQNRRSQ